MTTNTQSTTPQDTLKVFPVPEARLNSDLQLARNTLAIAMKNYAEDKTDENYKTMISARNEVLRLEEEYREGRRLLNEHLAQKMKGRKA